MSEIKAPVVPKLVPFEGKTPAFWSIYPNEDGTINASNGQTGETFEGTVGDFNVRLRG